MALYNKYFLVINGEVVYTSGTISDCIRKYKSLEKNYQKREISIDYSYVGMYDIYMKGGNEHVVKEDKLQFDLF